MFDKVLVPCGSQPDEPGIYLSFKDLNFKVMPLSNSPELVELMRLNQQVGEFISLEPMPILKFENYILDFVPNKKYTDTPGEFPDLHICIVNDSQSTQVDLPSVSLIQLSALVLGLSALLTYDSIERLEFMVGLNDFTVLKFYTDNPIVIVRFRHRPQIGLILDLNYVDSPAEFVICDSCWIYSDKVFLLSNNMLYTVEFGHVYDYTYHEHRVYNYGVVTQDEVIKILETEGRKL